MSIYEAILFYKARPFYDVMHFYEAISAPESPVSRILGFVQISGQIPPYLSEFYQNFWTKILWSRKSPTIKSPEFCEILMSDL